MLPYTKVKKKTNPDIQYVNLNHIKKDFGLQEKRSSFGFKCNQVNFVLHKTTHHVIFLIYLNFNNKTPQNKYINVLIESIISA